jgi:hypothetical protein
MKRHWKNIIACRAQPKKAYGRILPYAEQFQLLRKLKKILASPSERREMFEVQKTFQRRSVRLTSPHCVSFQLLRPILKRGHSTLPRLRCKRPDSDYTCRAQSCRYRSDEVRPFVRAFADSNCWLPGGVSRPRRKHPKNPYGGDASANAALKKRLPMIRIYSCIECKMRGMLISESQQTKLQTKIGI